jgi:hypothetical protein
MQSSPEIEAAKAELDGKETLLADIVSGKRTLGGGFEQQDRVTALQQRIAELKKLIDSSDVHRS